MRYLSVCSGIEAATVAWHPLGWTAAAYSEIEKFPSQVLAHHYPNTPNVGDMTKFKEWNIGSIDLLVGGTPCQSFSVAGLRKGLDDPRGNLMLTYLAIADQYRPRWLVWENVPGVLSSNGGKDFGVLLGALGELGYGFAYRILDAQYFGVAQRRRRVFVVGYLGDWRAAAAVLFERHSLSGDSAPSREKGEGVARGATHGLGEGSELARCLNACDTASGRMDVSVDTFVSQPIAFSGQMSEPQTDVELTQTLQAKNPMAVAIGTDLYNGAITGDVAVPMTNRSDATGTGPTVMQPVYELHSQDSRVRELKDVCTTVSATYGTGGGNVPITLKSQMAVRRLTPVECERLQGFPDSYTDIKPNNKATPDGPRYKALGNSMAVPVMAWIGKRIQMVENL